MPALKPAEFGEIYIPGFWNNTYKCTPSIFLSEYNYGNSFYSFEAGLVHFIFLNPYTPSDNTSKQYQFVIDDLLSVNRVKTPWIVVLTHCPFYSSNKAHYHSNQSRVMKVTKQLKNCHFVSIILIVVIVVMHDIVIFILIVSSIAVTINITTFIIIINVDVIIQVTTVSIVELQMTFITLL
jgi:Calcineurin-like phosphoesterase